MHCNNVIINVFALLALNFCLAFTQNIEGDFDWDYLVFSQRWPITACIGWKEEGNRTCSLPPYLDSWNVHGVWPTKNATDGPFSCPSAIHWDPQAIKPILNELQIYWVNIEASTKPYSFWAHEWNKHGTCASIVPQMDSVRNYFQEGLNLLKEYNMTNILLKGGIVPNADGYHVEEIYKAIKTQTGKEPEIHCVVDKDTKQTMLSEIRICFDKELNLRDCINKDPKSDINTDCSRSKPTMYYRDLPPAYQMDFVSPDHTLEQFHEYLEKQQYYYMLYRLFKMMIYVSL